MAKDEDKDLTRAEIRQALAKNLKEKVAAASEDLRKLRERELRRTAAPLSKNDLCLMCAQRAKVCVCLKKASAEEVNGEMKGFKSLASSPTFGGGSLTNAPKAAPRAGNGTKAASGTIQNAKAEPEPNLPKAGPGAVLPTSKKSKKVGGDEGSGGKIEKHGEVPPAAKAVTGVPGKQPVGQGGGDAHKVPHADTRAGLKDVKAMAPNAPHPATTAGLKDVKAMAPAASWKAGGLPKLRAALAANKAKQPLPSSDVDVSEFAQSPATAAKSPTLPMAPAAKPAARQPAHVPAAMGGAAQLAADKRAGGVGFLNSLLSRFRPAASAPPSTGSARATFGGGAPAAPAKRFHGALPLQRNEKALKKTFSLGNCAMCRKAEHSGLCKSEMAPPTEGLSSMNHNRTMLRVGQSGQRSKSKR